MMRYYNQTKTGVYQGFIIMGSAMPPMKYPEAAPYVTTTGFGAQYAIALIMNKKSLSRLPAELRKIVLDVGRSWGPVGDEAYAGANKWGHRTARKLFKKAKFSSLSDAERAKWANKIPNIAKQWAARLEKRGQPGNKALSMYMDALRAQGVNCARQWDKS
jgi:TRAP-type C4-dicarboxylate transport system substrate-binding protein